MYTQPIANVSSIHTTVEPKIYKMAFQGYFHNIEVRSYYGQGVSVYYAPAGIEHH
jgi:hypothetical protein